MRVALFGGSFNPIHRGHTSLAQRVVQTGAVDEVWVMPSPLNPLKQQRSDLLPFSERLHLCRLATAHAPHLQVCDVESRLPLPSYTWRTLSALRSEYPAHEFFLLIGEDNWQHFHRWREADAIRCTTPLLVYGRQTRGLTLHRPDGSALVLSSRLPLYPVSSTALRAAFARADLPFCRQWLNGHVLRYILRHHLYS